MVEIISAVTVSISAKWFEEVRQYKDFDAQAFLKHLKINLQNGRTLTGSYDEILEVKQMLEKKLVELEAKAKVPEIESDSDELNKFVRDLQEEEFIQSPDGVGYEPKYEPVERSELPSANSGVEIGIVGEPGIDNKEKEPEKDDPVIKGCELKGGQQRDEVQPVSSGKEKINVIGNCVKTYADVAKNSNNVPTVESTNQQIETNDVAGLNAIDKTPEVEVVPKCRARHRQNENFQVVDIPEGMAIEKMMVGVESITKTTDARIEWNKSDRCCTISGSSAAVNSIVKALDEMIAGSMIKDQDGFNTDPSQADHHSGLDAKTLNHSNHSCDTVVSVIEIPGSVSYDAALAMIKAKSSASKVDIELDNDDAKRVKLCGHSIAIENMKKALDGMIKSIAKLNDRDTDESRQKGDDKGYNSVDQVDSNLAVVHQPPNKCKINTTGSYDFNNIGITNSGYNTDQAKPEGCGNLAQNMFLPPLVSVPSGVVVNQPGRRQFTIEEDLYLKLTLKSTALDLKVFLYQADITLQRTDIIVNSTDVSLSESGMLSHSIMQKAGVGVRAECQNKISTMGPRQPGSIEVTSSGGLGPTVKYIIHAIGPNRAEAATNRHRAQYDYLYHAYYHSLMHAATDWSGTMRSISIPLIGANVLGAYNSSDAAFAAIKSFDNHWSSFLPKFRTKLNEIHIVSFNPKEVQDAINAFRKVLSQS